MPQAYSYLHLPYPCQGEPSTKDPEPGTLAAIIENNRIGRLQTKLEFWARQAVLARAVWEQEEARGEAEEERTNKGEGEGAKRAEEQEEEKKKKKKKKGQGAKEGEEWKGFKDEVVVGQEDREGAKQKAADGDEEINTRGQKRDRGDGHDESGRKRQRSSESKQ